MPFIKYPHVIRLGHPDIEGYLEGRVYVTPKLDGTNSCIWWEDDKIHCGSRNRELSLEYDNANFMHWVMSDDAYAERLRAFCETQKSAIVYGEWLGLPGSKMVGHIKTYLESGFYPFDVKALMTEDDQDFHSGFASPDAELYRVLQEISGDHFLTPYAVFDNPTEEQIVAEIDKNHFDLPDYAIGEGIVIKNYDFKSKYGHHEFAKIVREEYKQDKAKRKRSVASNADIEKTIVDMYVTNADMEKCKQKVLVLLEREEWENESKAIGMFMTMLFRDLIEEEMFDIIKKLHRPTVNFKVLEDDVKRKARDFLRL